MPLSSDKSTFLSVLDWFDQPSQAVLSLLKGRPMSALRHAGDFLLDPIDAVLPGDVIPKFTRDEDVTSASDVLGIDRQQHPFLGSVADAIGGAVTNPLSYLGFGEGRGLTALGKTVAFDGQTVDPLTMIGKAARAGIDRLPQELDAKGLPTGRGLRPAVNRALQGTRETFGYVNPNEDVADLVARSDALATRVARAKQPALEDMFAGTNPVDRQNAFRLINNYDRDAQGKAFALGPDSGGKYGTLDEQDALLQARLANAPWAPEQKTAAYDLATKALTHERQNFLEAVQDFPGMFSLLENGQQLGTHAPLDYTRRDFDFGLPETSGRYSPANPLAARSARTTQRLLETLNNPQYGHRLEEDLGVSTSERSRMQALLAKKAQVGYELVNRGATGELGPAVQEATQRAMAEREAMGKPTTGFSSLADSESRTLVDQVIGHLKTLSPDDARVLETAYNGLEPRGWITGAFAKLNKFFKPAAVYGFGWPGKPATVMRNIIAFPTQLGSEEGLGLGQALRQLKNTPANIGYAFGKGVDQTFGTSLTRGAVADDMELIDKAYAAANGRDSVAIQTLKSAGRDDLVDALTHGVYESGFRASELLPQGVREARGVGKVLDKLGASPGFKKKFYDWLTAPGESFQGAEDFARSTNFFDVRKRLLDSGMAPEQAAKQAAAKIRSALYDYNTVSENQRALSDVIPFAKFQTNAIRQGAKVLSRVPAVGTTLAGLYGDQPDEPLYPYLQEQAHVRTGRDEAGNPQYLAGLGLPIESLNLVPNITGTSSLRSLGREVERTFGGSSQPVLKTAYGAISGHDPYFDTPFMSYDRLPGNFKGGEAARVLNLIENTGLVQPIVTPAQQIGKLIDERHSIAAKAIDLLTGANVVSVDPNLAVQQQLTQELTNRPDVRQTRDLYVPKGEADDDTVALLKELARLKAAAKKTRQPE